MIALALFQFFTLRGGQPWYDDFALYVLHARNLVQGIPYADTGYLYNPQNPWFSPQTYPPGFPLLIAPVYALAGFDLQALRLVVIMSFVGVLYVFSLLLRPHHSPGYVLAAVGLLGLQPYYLSFKDLLLPDLSFVLFALLSVYLLRRLHEGVRTNFGIAVLAGICIYYAVSLRTIGITLGAALGAYHVLRWQWPSRAVFLAAGIALLFYGIQLQLMPSGLGYATQIHDVAATHGGSGLVPTAERAGRMAHAIEGVFDVGWLPMTIALVTVAGLLAAIGFISRVRRLSIVETFVLAYTAALLVWPGVQARYFIPLVPFMLHYVMLGLGVIRGWNERAGRASALAIFGVVSTTYLVAAVRAERTLFSPDVTSVDSQQLFGFLDRCTMPQDRVIATRPRAIALYAERYATPPPGRFTADKLTDFAIAGDFRYLVAVRGDSLDIVPQRRPAAFHPVFSNGEHVVYRTTALAGAAHNAGQIRIAASCATP